MLNIEKNVIVDGSGWVIIIIFRYGFRLNDNFLL